jgi:hypothetical protein
MHGCKLRFENTPNGGACALGHPVRASGSRLVGTTALKLRRRGVDTVYATICGGMGLGAATILEATLNEAGGVDFFGVAVVETQRALRRFGPDAVGTRELRRILDAATDASLARGAEPWVFVVVRDPALRAEIGRCYRAAWDAGEHYTRATDADP